jgi:hypothetical protein
LHHKEMEMHLKLTFDYDKLIRSRVIQAAIAVEKELEGIITWHFCPDKAKHLSFMSLFFQEGQISFSMKTEIAKKMLKKEYPEIFKEIKSIFTQIENLRTLRNKVAHCELVIPEKPIPIEKQGGIEIAFYKNGQNKTEFVEIKMVTKLCENSDLYALILTTVKMGIEDKVAPGPIQTDVLADIKVLVEAVSY